MAPLYDSISSISSAKILCLRFVGLYCKSFWVGAGPVLVKEPIHEIHMIGIFWCGYSIAERTDIATLLNYYNA